MKKYIITLLALSALVLPAFAAEGDAPKSHFKPYGFFRTYGLYDSRMTKALAEDLFLFIPLRENVQNDVDLNGVGSFNYTAISTRLGLDVVGYEIGQMKINGKVEADFYCLNSGGNTGTLRMRQAFINLLWDSVDAGDMVDMSLKIGQTWHPMAADMPHTIALETGAPFGPFNRSAQLTYDVTLSKKLILTASAIMQMQYRSAGPAAAGNKYQRHGLPEFYAGVSYKDGGFLGRVGVSVLNIAPQYGYDATTGKKYSDRLTSVQPFVFLQYSGNNFQVKAKSIFAGAGEYMQLNSGYAVTTAKEDGISFNYTPLRQSVSFISAQWGKKFQVLGMVGFHKNLGPLGTEIDPTKVYFSGNGFSDIDWMARVSPTIAYNFGKFQLALEYGITAVAYGNGIDNKGQVLNVTAPVMNHRVLAMAKFSF